MQALIVNHSTIRINSKNMQNILDHIVKCMGQNKPLKNVRKLRKSEVTLVYISAARMKAMNFKYRNKNYATDILSFEPSSADSLGDLVLCPSVLKKQAKQNGHSFDFEMLYMIIHGLLHLLGYDHEISLTEEKKMFGIQDRLFSQLTEAKINLHLTHVNRRRSQ